MTTLNMLKHLDPDHSGHNILGEAWTRTWLINPRKIFLKASSPLHCPLAFVPRSGKANVGTSEGVVQHVHLFCTCYPPGGWHCTRLRFHWIPAALYPLPIAWTCLLETQIRQMNVETKCNTEYASGVNHILLLHVRGLLSCTGSWFGVGTAGRSALGLDGAPVHDLPS